MLLDTALDICSALPVRPIVFFDLETTRSFKELDSARAWELGIVRIGTDAKWTSKNIVINCGEPIAPDTLAWMNEHRPEVTADGHLTGMDERDALIRFAKVIEGCQVIAHNGSSFDVPIMVNAFARHNLPVPTELALAFDSCLLAREVFGKGNASLASLKARFSIEAEGHKASEDALATAKAFIALVQAGIAARFAALQG